MDNVTEVTKIVKPIIDFEVYHKVESENWERCSVCGDTLKYVEVNKQDIELYCAVCGSSNGGYTLASDKEMEKLAQKK